MTARELKEKLNRLSEEDLDRTMVGFDDAYEANIYYEIFEFQLSTVWVPPCEKDVIILK